MDEDLKARLLKPRLPEDTVEIPGVGTVRVRALNRAESMMVQGANGLEATERRIVALGMVDPSMTEAEVGQWQKASPGGEIDAVSNKIAELSGLLDGAAKEQYKSLRDGSDARVRVLPGAEAGDDGGQPAGADER